MTTFFEAIFCWNVRRGVRQGGALSLLLLAGVAYAQNDAGADAATAELLENYFRDNENATESDAQIFLETLDNLRQHPLDLNRAERDELLNLRLLRTLQVDALLDYRRQLGPLLNLYELQAVPGWELDDVRRLQPFVKVSGALDERAIPLRQGFYRGDNELIVRWGRAIPLPADLGKMEGSPNAFAVRYRHTFENRLRFGFTAENDPGEAFFKQSNRQGFDFYSAHLFLQNTSRHRLRALALGDYTLRMGQGLLLQTGFAPGKSAEAVTLARGGRKLGAYGAFGEVYFLRGAGATLSLTKHLELTTFASYRRRDANIGVARDTFSYDPEQAVFTALQASGLHRTAAEVADENALKETLGGASLTYQRQRGSLSINALHIAYDKPWEPTPAPYRRYTFSGQRLTGLSVDYQYTWRNFFFFGENARSDNGGTALLNSVIFNPDRRATVAVVQRRYAANYQSIYASPFSESSNGANEQGLYLGLELRPNPAWRFDAYADTWKHPWLRFGVSAPSAGNEALARLLWQPTKTFSTYALFQTENKQRDGSSETGLINNRRNRLRLHAGYKVGQGIDLRSRVEWMFFKEGNLPQTQGFLAYQEVVFKSLGKPLSGALRYALFDTDNFDTRVYSFENDLFAAVSIPGFAGRGSRYYVNLQWRLNKVWRLEGRFQTTVIQRSVTTGTPVGRESAVKFQLRAQW